MHSTRKGGRPRRLTIFVPAAAAMLTALAVACSAGFDGWTASQRTYFITLAQVGGWTESQAVCATKTLEKQYAWEDFRAKFVVGDRPGASDPLISVPELARPVLDGCPK